MKLPKAKLIQNGYKPIVSDVQAYQLLRRELKFARSEEQRYGHIEWFRTSWCDLQEIKAGMWYKFVLCKGRGAKVLLLAEPSDDDAASLCDELPECS